MVKNQPNNARDIGDAVSIPGSERSLEEAITIHFSILAWKIPTDGGARWATVHRIARVNHD